MTQDRPFTMGFKDAMMYGIDYRDYEKVRELPKGVELTAVAGVWGDYSNLRCLFVTADDDRICRTVFNRLKYWLPEIERHGKEIEIDEVFLIANLWHSHPVMKLFLCQFVKLFHPIHYPALDDL